MESLRQLETILAILLGWLLGLLTPAIAERIRRQYKRQELMDAVIDEMLGLQHTLATVAHLVRLRNADLPDAFLDGFLPIFEGYEGPDRKEALVEVLKNIRNVPEGQRSASLRSLREPNAGMALQQYAVPLFTTQVADLAICSLDFQRSVLRIRNHLDLFNQLVP